MTQKILIQLKEFFSTQPVEKAWVFGSYARGEETSESDLDIMVSYVQGVHPGLFGIYKIVELLEKKLGVKVDLVEQGTMYPRVAKEVESQKILAYERNA